MKHLVCAVVLPFLALAPRAAGAQSIPDLPISVEVRVGAGVPTGELADEDPGAGAEAGPAFGAAALFHFSEVLSAYGGYSRAVFGCSRCGESGIDEEVVDAGGELGLQAALPVRLAGASPWLRGGAVLRQLTFSGQGGRLSSDPAVGFEVGAGVSVPVIRSVTVSPGIRFRSYSADLDLGGLPGRTVDVSHVVADIGFAYRF